MAKIKVTQQVVNRGGKKYIAKDGFIEVSDADMQFFDGFKIETPKKKKNENTKKES